MGDDDHFIDKKRDTTQQKRELYTNVELKEFLKTPQRDFDFNVWSVAEN